MVPAEIDGLSTDLVISGSGLVAGGVALGEPSTGIGTVDINIPTDVDVAMALLYWELRDDPGGPHDPAYFQVINVDGQPVTGQFIGGNNPELPNGRSFAYRADITDLITPGANSLEIDASVFPDFAFPNGASVLVVLDDGSTSAIEIRDGEDFACLWLFDELMTTEPQTFFFASSSVDRVADLWLIVGDVENSRPNKIEVTVNGQTQWYVTGEDEGTFDAFGDGADGRNGPEWDTKHVPVTIPAGADQMTVQLHSYNDFSGKSPASLAWITAGLSVPPDHFAEGRMTGGGVVRLLDINGDLVRFTHGFTLHCDNTLSNNLEINWGGRQWHIEKESLENISCTDDPDVTPEPPPAPFDTFEANAFGRLDGVWGSYIWFKLQDAGEPGGNNDKAGLKIWAVGADPSIDDPVVYVPFDFTVNGNLQAHYDQPHGNKP
jgi:hypothetical protein